MRGRGSRSSGSWAPDVPALNPGEAAAFWVPCSCLNFQCATNKTTPCGSAWDFDLPTSLTTCCGGNITVAILDTETNEVCPQTVTRTWLIADSCGHSNTCSQAVTILDVTPPTISYTPLANTTSTANRTLSTTITDADNGVPNSGTGLPERN